MFTDNERFVNCVVLETEMICRQRLKIYDQVQRTDVGTKFDKLKHMRVTNNRLKIFLKTISLSFVLFDQIEEK